MNPRRILPSLMVTESFPVECVYFAQGGVRTHVDPRGHRMAEDVDRCHLSSQTVLPTRRGHDAERGTLMLERSACRPAPARGGCADRAGWGPAAPGSRATPLPAGRG